MRRLAHLSDLHFGAVAAETVELLHEDLSNFAPDLVVVTGDLTQRARTSELIEARRFLGRLACPYLVVPGNHDLAPVHRPFARLASPFANFRRYFGTDLEPVYHDEELLVIGLNTAEPLFWKEGSISRKQLDWVTSRAHDEAAKSARFRIVAAHHPLATTRIARLPPRRDERRIAERLTAAGIQLCLSGHLHKSQSGRFTSPERTSEYAAAGALLAVHAATATSHRLRGESNSYNRLELDFPELHITVQGLAKTDRCFAPVRRESFVRENDTWHRLGRAL